jgi:hypothetical protein
MEPVVEELEDRQQLLLGGCAAAPRFGLDPVKRPALLAQLQERDDEVILGGEVAIERGLGNAGARSITSSTPTARIPRRANS